LGSLLLMDIRSALKGQFRAGLHMLQNCVELCPDDLWTGGQHPRNFWRIAFHAVFYAHLYLGQNEGAFSPWIRPLEDAKELWENPRVVDPYQREEIIDYIRWLDSNVDSTFDGLDLDSPDSGFDWYPDFPKLDHEILNIRHLQGHVGQLSELLMARGIDSTWIRRIPR
jgi:hypothetical protein